jgi:hypothetical protein
MNFHCPLVNLTVGIQKTMKLAASRAAINEFDTADLDDAVAVARREARGFGVEDDLAHGTLFDHNLQEPAMRAKYLILCNLPGFIRASG